MTLEETYDAYAGTVYRFFYIKCLDKAVAQDLTSQTFMALVERLHEERVAGSDLTIRDMKKFTYGVMRNVWLMYLRQKYQRNEHVLEDADEFEAYVVDEIGEYGAHSVKQRAEPYINRLPERQRAVVYMRLLQERSIVQIAADIGKDTNYVKTTYKRGIKRLKLLIADNVMYEEAV
jgi:RNA polymerase sigma-70 factor (ECF subfamily)